VKSAAEMQGGNREGRVRATIMPKKAAPETPAASGTGSRN
jgi:hypothetical protein